MKQIFILLSLLVLFVGCNGVTHNAADIPISGNTGNGVTKTVYSIIYGGNPDSYQSITLGDDGSFEMFATQLGGGVITGWVKVEGTYTLVGSTLTFISNVSEKNSYPMNCGDPLNYTYNYVEVGDSITLTDVNGSFTMDDESVSGVGKPDVSAKLNECP